MVVSIMAAYEETSETFKEPGGLEKSLRKGMGDGEKLLGGALEK